jgi:hypothetical protein
MCSKRGLEIRVVQIVFLRLDQRMLPCPQVFLPKKEGDLQNILRFYSVLPCAGQAIHVTALSEWATFNQSWFCENLGEQGSY